ncbi:MAG: cupin domain-containing protein [Pseudomonadota bacterium]
MKIVRHDEAPAYTAPGHTDMSMKRLQGLEASDASFAWIGLSRIEPGGHTDLKASDSEKLYVVLEGEVTFNDGEAEITAHRLDSIHFPRGASRQLRNDSTGREALVLLVMETR